MLDLVRKRHEGDGWVVFSELANATGAKIRGFADAVAFGIWPSRGYELIGYEFKESREDLKKELRDPQKADNIGKFCTQWWLCVRKQELLEGLLVPDTWGILIPATRGSSQMFAMHRPAPKQEPQPITPGLVASMIRNVTKTWIPKSTHQGVVERLNEIQRKNSDSNLPHAHELAKSKIADLEKQIVEISAATGITFDNRYQYEDIGNAVRAVMTADKQSSDYAIRQRIMQLSRDARQYQEVAKAAAEAADALRRSYEIKEHSPWCPKTTGVKQDECTCAVAD